MIEGAARPSYVSNKRQSKIVSNALDVFLQSVDNRFQLIADFGSDLL
jgi:hypothetical protein